MILRITDANCIFFIVPIFIPETFPQRPTYVANGTIYISFFSALDHDDYVFF